MARNKTCGLGLYSLDLFRGAADSTLYECVARLFDSFVRFEYPVELNRLLLLPIYKGKGSRLDPSNHRPISLIHPLGRWFAKCVASRLEAETLECRAVC